MKRVLGDINPNVKMQQTSKDDLLMVKKGAVPQKDSVKTEWRELNGDMLDQTSTTVAAPLSQPALRPQSTKTSSTASVPLPPSVNTTVVVKPSLGAKKSMKVLRDKVALPDEPRSATLVQEEKDSSAQPLAEVTNKANTTQAVTEQSTESHVKLATSTTLQPAAPEQHMPSMNSSADKEYIVHLEKQAEYFEAQEYQNISTLPPCVPLPSMTTQQYFATEDYALYDDGYTTARSFDLSGESTAAFTTILVPKTSEKTKLEIEAAKRYVETLRTPEDIDDELWDTSMVAEYGDEIFDYMRHLEERMLPDPRYMDIQQEIQWSMRAVLVDWVVQVHQRFTLLPETLFLAINYIDRFLSHKVVSLGKLQLVGATALFIAAKFEEVNCPTLQEVIFMVDGGYTVDELLKAERFMLSMLQFDLGWPGPMSFLRRVSKADDYDLETRTLAKYFLEVTVMDERFIGCTPSFLAAGAHCLARLMLRKGDWSVAHVAYSNYTYAQLRPLLHGIMECCDNPRHHHLSVYEKYTDKRYKCASTFVEAEILKGFSLLARLSIRSSFGSPAGAITNFT